MLIYAAHLKKVLNLCAYLKKVLIWLAHLDCRPNEKWLFSLCLSEIKCSSDLLTGVEHLSCRHCAHLSKSFVKKVHNWLAQLKQNFIYAADLRKSAHLVCSSENKCSSGLLT